MVAPPSRAITFFQSRASPAGRASNGREGKVEKPASTRARVAAEKRCGGYLCKDLSIAALYNNDVDNMISRTSLLNDSSLRRRSKSASPLLLGVPPGAVLMSVIVPAQAPALRNPRSCRRADQRAADKADRTEHESARGAAQDAVHDRLARAGRRRAKKDQRQSEKKSAHGLSSLRLDFAACGLAQTQEIGSVSTLKARDSRSGSPLPRHGRSCRQRS